MSVFEWSLFQYHHAEELDVPAPYRKVKVISDKTSVLWRYLRGNFVDSAYQLKHVFILNSILSLSTKISKCIATHIFKIYDTVRARGLENPLDFQSFICF